MNLGHGHRRSVLILWAWTALLSGFVLYPILTTKRPDLPAVRDRRHRHRSCSRSCTRRCARPAGRNGNGTAPLTSLTASATRGARRLAAGLGEVGVALAFVPADSSSWAAAATAPHATHASAPPTETRATPAAASSATDGPPGEQEHVHRPVDGRHDGADVLDREQPRCVEHVGPGLLVRLQPGDRVVEVADAVDQVLGPRREHQAARSGRLGGGGHALGGQTDVVDRSDSLCRKSSTEAPAAPAAAAAVIVAATPAGSSAKQSSRSAFTGSGVAAASAAVWAKASSRLTSPSPVTERRGEPRARRGDGRRSRARRGAWPTPRPRRSA